MSLNFSRLLGGSAVHVNSALPAGIAANIALAAGGFSASSFLPLSHGGGQREHASQKGPVSSENGCSASPYVATLSLRMRMCMLCECVRLFV